MTQTTALDVLKTGSNVFLTGSAGSGKTHVLNRFIDYLKLQNKTVGITASTGVAATHINGMTINAWAGIGVKSILTAHDIDDLLHRRYLRERIQKTKVLIIDEVSMLSAQTLETVDVTLQAFKENEEPFGGIQIVLCGDFFQLPPIEVKSEKGEVKSTVLNTRKTFHLSPSTSHFRPQYIYRSSVWESLDLKVCYLEQPFRQDDEQFLQILDQIRHNNITKEIWMTLKDRFFQSFYNGVAPTRLYTHNSRADAVNNQELAKLKDSPHEYMMKTKGNAVLADVMKKSCLAPERLILKKRALVMFVKNNFDEGYANGTMGRIIDFTEKESYPIVETFAKKQIVVKSSEWIIEEDGEVQSTLVQIPLRLAWAITIHKSQGMSLDAAEIDLGKSFVTGMGYVAFSRVRSLNGIRLRSLNRTALSVSEEVVRVDKRLQELSNQVVAEIEQSPYYKINKK